MPNNIGAFGENFPYANQHDMNMDWVIKIAKDFLDKYSTLEQTLDEGQETLANLATQLEGQLNQWYETHSDDIANQLTQSLAQINTALTNATNSFNTSAEQKGLAVIASIPSEYTELTKEVESNGLTLLPVNHVKNVDYTDGAYRYYNSGEIRSNDNYRYTDYIVVIPDSIYKITGAENTHTTFYDQGYNFVSGSLDSVIKSPSNAVYMVVSYAIADENIINVEWVNNFLTTDSTPIRTSSQLADFDDAEWNKWYSVNILLETDFYTIAHAPIYENGILFTFTTDEANYAGRQIYITNSGKLYTRFYVPATDTFTEWETSSNKDGVMYNEDLTSAIRYQFAGTFDVVDGGYSITNVMVCGKYYAIENRTCSFLFKAMGDSISEFVTTIDGVSNINTHILFDVPNKRIKLNDFDYVSVPFLTGNHYYTFDLGKHYQKLTIDITDMQSGNSKHVEYTKDGTGGAGSGAIGTGNNVPMQYDYYGVKYVSGTPFLVNHMTVRTKPVDVVMYGDSITEPEAYYPTSMFEESWTQLVINNSSKRCVTSGRSSTGIARVNERIVNELPFIGAKYCVVTIGTNGGNTEQNLDKLINLIKQCGAIPILNHIPCYDNNGDNTGFRAENQLIDV
ncbi:MAG: hypothetical protein IIY21_08755, partial [Clostridiales bacterium]|nr:hypothetical protein [Clostridiales bacterium]